MNVCIYENKVETIESIYNVGTMYNAEQNKNKMLETVVVTNMSDVSKYERRCAKS